MNEVLLGVLSSLAGGFRNLNGLADAAADAALAVADDDQRSKAHVAAALHGLGDAVDRNHLLLELALLAALTARAALTAIAALATLTTLERLLFHILRHSSYPPLT